MAKFGWQERRLFYVSESAFENLASTPATDADTGQMLAYIKLDHLYIKKPTVAEVLIPENGSNIGGFTEVFKQKNSSAQLEFRTIQSSLGTVDITQNANDIDINVDLTDINDELDHGFLLGLADDDHLQYLLLAGRAGGQIAHGGTAASDDLELRSTSNATKGSVQIIDGSEFRHADNHKQQYEVQTTDATVTSLAVIPLLDDKVYQFKVMIVARRSDGGGQARSAIELQACAYRAAAGSATLQGSVKQNFENKSANVSADIDVSGNDLRVRVTGLAAQDFEWTAYVEYLESN